MAERGAGDKNKDISVEKTHQGGVAFHVDFDVEGKDRPQSAVPDRVRNYKKRTVTREELDRKQLEAENRRKGKEQEMLQRIHQAQDDVAKLNQNFSVLLEADARRQGVEGTSESTLSRQQLKEKFHEVNSDYKKMVNSIASNTKCSK